MANDFEPVALLTDLASDVERGYEQYVPAGAKRLIRQLGDGLSILGPPGPPPSGPPPGPGPTGPPPEPSPTAFSPTGGPPPGLEPPTAFSPTAPPPPQMPTLGPPPGLDMGAPPPPDMGAPPAGPGMGAESDPFAGPPPPDLGPPPLPDLGPPPSAPAPEPQADPFADFGGFVHRLTGGQINPLESSGVAPAFRAGVGDVVESLGHGLEYAGQKGGLLEPLAGAGQTLVGRGQAIHAANPVPEYNWDEKGAGSLVDPRFYRDVVVRGVPFTAALIPVGLAAGMLSEAGLAAVGLAEGAPLAATTAGALSRGAVTLASQAAGSRLVESLTEAGQTYQQALDRGQDPDHAGSAADSVFAKNMALTGLEAAEWATPLAKMPKGLRDRLAGGLLEKWGRAGWPLAKMLVGAGMEGVEEGAQEIFQRQALGDQVALDASMATQIAAGAVQGALFGVGGQAAGHVRGRLDEAAARRAAAAPEFAQFGDPTQQAVFPAAGAARDMFGNDLPDDARSAGEQMKQTGASDLFADLPDNAPRVPSIPNDTRFTAEDGRSGRVLVPGDTPDSYLVMLAGDQVPTHMGGETIRGYLRGKLGEGGARTGMDVAAPSIAATEPETGQPTMQAPPATEADMAELMKLQRSVPVADVGVDPVRFQFKNAGIVDPASGVTAKLQDETDWNPITGGTLYGWEDEAGKVWVVNGHHRLELAKRLGVKSVPMVVHREQDGVSETDARVEGALQNVAEGNGTPFDVAKLLRDQGLRGPDAEAWLAEQKVNRRSNLARQGLALSNLSDMLFERLRAGQISDEQGAVIGAELPGDDAAQKSVADELARRTEEVTPRALRETIQAAKAAGTATGTQTGLFGEETFSINTLFEEGALRAWVKDQLAKNKRVLGFVAKRADEIQGVEGNVVNVAGSSAAATESARLSAYFDALVNAPGPVNAAVRDAAAAIINKENPGAVRTRLLAAVTGAIESESGPGADGGRAQGDLGEHAPAAPLPGATAPAAAPGLGTPQPASRADFEASPARPAEPTGPSADAGADVQRLEVRVHGIGTGSWELRNGLGEPIEQLHRMTGTQVARYEPDRGLRNYPSLERAVDAAGRDYHERVRAGGPVRAPEMPTGDDEAATPPTAAEPVPSAATPRPASRADLEAAPESAATSWGPHTLVERRTVEGVRYEFHRRGDQGRVRVYDADSGNVVQMRDYPTVQAGLAAYDDTVEKAQRAAGEEPTRAWREAGEPRPSHPELGDYLGERGRALLPVWRETEGAPDDHVFYDAYHAGRSGEPLTVAQEDDPHFLGAYRAGQRDAGTAPEYGRPETAAHRFVVENGPVFLSGKVSQRTADASERIGFMVTWRGGGNKLPPGKVFAIDNNQLKHPGTMVTRTGEEGFGPENFPVEHDPFHDTYVKLGIERDYNRRIQRDAMQNLIDLHGEDEAGWLPADARRFFDAFVDRYAADAALRERLLFVVMPDVPGDTTGTIKTGQTFARFYDGTGVPMAQVLGPGAEDHLDRVPWDLISYVFIPRKIDEAWFDRGEGPRKIVERARAEGVMVHMAPVASGQQFTRAAELGADSMDSTYLGRGEDVNLPSLVKWLGEEPTAEMLARRRERQEAIRRAPKQTRLPDATAPRPATRADLEQAPAAERAPAAESIADLIERARRVSSQDDINDVRTALKGRPKVEQERVLAAMRTNELALNKDNRTYKVGDLLTFHPNAADWLNAPTSERWGKGFTGDPKGPWRVTWAGGDGTLIGIEHTQTGEKIDRMSSGQHSLGRYLGEQTPASAETPHERIFETGRRLYPEDTTDLPPHSVAEFQEMIRLVALNRVEGKRYDALTRWRELDAMEKDVPADREYTPVRGEIGRRKHALANEMGHDPARPGWTLPPQRAYRYHKGRVEGARTTQELIEALDALPKRTTGFTGQNYDRLRAEGEARLAALRPTAEQIAEAEGARPSEPAAGDDRILLITCVDGKLDKAAPARRLYDSVLFRKAAGYAESSGHPWFILSAKHELVHPDQTLDPYNRKMADLTPAERATWATNVVQQLTDQAGGSLRGKTVEVHAGALYRDSGLVAGLKKAGATVDLPMQGLKIGEWQRWYDQHATAAAPVATPAAGPTSIPRPASRDDWARSADARHQDLLGAQDALDAEERQRLATREAELAQLEKADATTEQGAPEGVRPGPGAEGAPSAAGDAAPGDRGGPTGGGLDRPEDQPPDLVPAPAPGDRGEAEPQGAGGLAGAAPGPGGPTGDDHAAAARASERFAPYHVRHGAGVAPHPRLVVETRVLSGVPYPPLTYTPAPSIRAWLERPVEGKLGISDVQYDAIAAAGQAFERGHGLLVADDVGVGKTREILGIMLDYFDHGHTEPVLVTTYNPVNVLNMIEEWLKVHPDRAKGENAIRVVAMPDHKADGQPKQQNKPDLPTGGRVVYLLDSFNFAKYQQTIERVQPGVWLADEAHEYKNQLDSRARGDAWRALHVAMLAAKKPIAYFTATPAQDPKDLQYLYALRQWGEADADFVQFILRVKGIATDDEARQNALRAELFGDPKRPPPPANVATGGATGDVINRVMSLAEMQQLTAEMKRKGLYMSRDLWRGGVEFDHVDLSRTDGPSAPMSEAQLAEKMARHEELVGVIRDAFSAFADYAQHAKSSNYASLQRSFSQFAVKRNMLDMRADAVVGQAKERLARGQQVVIYTGAVKSPHKRPGTEENPEDLKGHLAAAIRMIPTERNAGTNEDPIWIEIPEAKERQRALLARAARLRLRDPIEFLTGSLGGEDQVALVIGQTTKLKRKQVMNDFQAGRRPVAIVSDAGTTGIDLQDKGTGRRVLMFLDTQWSGEKFKQTMGRVDRADQTSSPEIVLYHMGTPAERKFITTIANRLQALGALSKGQANTTGTENLGDFEVEGAVGTAALRLAFPGLSPQTRRAFTDPSLRARATPDRDANAKKFLLDLMFMPHEAALEASSAFQEEYTRLSLGIEAAEAETRAADRTRGAVLKTTPLAGDELVIHELRPEVGPKFGLIEGVMMLTSSKDPGRMRMLKAAIDRGKPLRYTTFTEPATGRARAGVRVPATRMDAVASAFGVDLERAPRTVEDVLTDARNLEIIPLKGPGGKTMTLRWEWIAARKEHGLVARGPSIADRAALEAVGAFPHATPGQGLGWHVDLSRLGEFLDEFPPTDGLDREPAPTALREALASLAEEPFVRDALSHNLDRIERFLAEQGTGPLTLLSSGPAEVLVDLGSRHARLAPSAERERGPIPRMLVPDPVMRYGSLKVEVYPVLSAAEDADVAPVVAALAEKGYEWRDPEARHLARLESGAVVLRWSADVHHEATAETPVDPPTPPPADPTAAAADLRERLAGASSDTEAQAAVLQEIVDSGLHPDAIDELLRPAAEVVSPPGTGEGAGAGAPPNGRTPGAPPSGGGAGGTGGGAGGTGAAGGRRGRGRATGRGVNWRAVGGAKGTPTYDPRRANPLVAKMMEPEVADYVQRWIDDHEDELQAARGGVIPDSEIAAAAEKIRAMAGVDPQKFLRLLNWKRGDIVSGEAILALRGFLRDTTVGILALQKKVRAGDHSAATEADLLLHVRLYGAVKEAVLGVRAEYGRGLRTFQQMIEAAAGEHDLEALKRLLDRLGGHKTAEEITDLLRDVDLSDPDDPRVHAVLRNVTTPGAGDYLNELFVNYLVSALPTQAVNFTSNLVQVWFNPLEKVAAALVDMPMSRVQGRGRERFVHEAPEFMAGAIAGIGPGVADALRVMRSGYDASITGGLEGQLGRRPYERAFTGTLGRVVNTPTTLLEMADVLFRSVTMQGELRALAYRRGRVAGMRGDDLVAFAQGEILRAATNGLAAEARAQADYRLFRQPAGAYMGPLIGLRERVRLFERERVGDIPALGGVLRGVLGDRLGDMPIKLKPLAAVLPFMLTPANIFKYSMERSPLAILSPGLWHDAFGANANAHASDRLARWLIGATIAAGIASFFGAGLITGGPPPNKEERDRFYREGKIPYAVKIGDHWVSYQRLEPLNTTLTMVAAVVEASHRPDLTLTEKASAAAFSIANNLFQQNFLVGLSDLMDAIQQPDRHAERFFTRIFVAWTVPFSSFTRTVAQQMDPTVRDARTLKDAYQAAIPGLTQNVPARLDAFGRVERRENIGGALNPYKIVRAKGSPVDRALAARGVEVGFSGKSINGAPLTPPEQHQLQALAGPIVERNLERIVSSSAYGRADPLAQERLLRTAISRGRSDAAAQMIRQIGGEREIAARRRTAASRRP